MWISLKIPLKFVPRGPINNILALVQIMAWRRPGDKPLSEPMLVFVPTHICDTRSQWVNLNFGNLIIWHLCGNFDSRHQGVSPCLDYWNVLMFVASLTSRYLWKRRVLRYNQYLFITGSCSFFHDRLMVLKSCVVWQLTLRIWHNGSERNRNWTNAVSIGHISGHYGTL